ncbi:MAG TPA: hypothetical protein VJZ03_03295 [Candidatus Bathyarchaeia archaeon]|nr:hypothetical protein [Candidatus Bathyarchaeia archaeon]
MTSDGYVTCRLNEFSLTVYKDCVDCPNAELNRENEIRSTAVARRILAYFISLRDLYQD